MARPIRIQYPGAVYHVMARGNQGQEVFRDHQDRKTFLTSLGEACAKTGWEIHAGVLMANHYHLLLQTPEPNLVEGMKWLQGTYTQRIILGPITLMGDPLISRWRSRRCTMPACWARPCWRGFGATTVTSGLRITSERPRNSRWIDNGRTARGRMVEEPKQKWVDSFHTGYNLLALREIGRHLEVPGLAEAVRRGYDYYRRHFFREDGAVRYFHDRTYPVDAHAVGHALLTLAEFAEEDPTALAQAARCFAWAMENLRSPKGNFFYQSRRWFKNRISYMRWSQAWMLTGLVALLRQLTPPPPPLFKSEIAKTEIERCE